MSLRLKYSSIIFLLMGIPLQNFCMQRSSLLLSIDDLTHSFDKLSHALSSFDYVEQKKTDFIPNNSVKNSSHAGPKHYEMLTKANKEEIFTIERAHPTDDFFRYVTGMSEEEFRKKFGWKNGSLSNDIGETIDQIIIKSKIDDNNYPGASILHYSKNNFYTVNTLEKSSKPRAKGTFTLLLEDADNKNLTDILYLQGQPSNYKAYFQLASTPFGVLEGGIIDSNSRLTDMLPHAVQGEFGSIGVTGSSIFNKYIFPTNNKLRRIVLPAWTQSRASYAQDLPDYTKYYFNLYANLKIPMGVFGNDKRIGVDLTRLADMPIVGIPKEPLIDNVGVVLKQNIVVTCAGDAQGKTFGLQVAYNPTTKKIDENKTQIISQVLCSALNLRNKDKTLNGNPELKSGRGDNLEAWEHVIMDGSYKATIMTAINNGCKKLYVTMLGVGSFNNDIRSVSQALKATRDLIKNSEMEVILVYHYVSKNGVTLQENEKFLNDMYELQQAINGRREKSIQEVKAYIKDLAASQPKASKK